MTRDEQLIRAVQAALDAAADAADNPARPMDYLMGDRPLSRYDVCIHDNMMGDDCLPCSIAAIRAIDPAEVLAKVGDGWPPIEVKARALKEIVEGISGAMNHGTWRDENGMRLKDTPEWVQFYNAITHPTAGGPQ